MSERLPRLRPDELDVAQRAVYESITKGARAQRTQLFALAADDGSLHGPFGAMVWAPGIGAALQSLGSAVRFQSDLTERCREIAVLQVAQSVGSAFEWWAHERVARAVGVSDVELDALSRGEFRSEDPIEAGVSSFCALLLASDVMSDQDFATASAVLGYRQMIELTVLVGYYRTLAQLMAVFDVGVPVT